MSKIVTEKANIKTHKDLDVWKKSMDLVEEVYRFTQGFPGSEKYGLINQIRRCAISVPSNIAEGSVRNTSKETTQFIPKVKTGQMMSPGLHSSPITLYSFK